MQRRWVAVASASHRDHTLKIRESSLRDHTIVSILKLEMGFVSKIGLGRKRGGTSREVSQWVNVRTRVHILRNHVKLCFSNSVVSICNPWVKWEAEVGE